MVLYLSLAAAPVRTQAMLPSQRNGEILSGDSDRVMAAFRETCGISSRSTPG